ncbi:MAG: ABC transporter substrate-binding protein [Alphaproteobacteria bacterium]|nr:ABC transporter substrate-binding protein [Alphaproteobacteria bacterium]
MKKLLCVLCMALSLVACSEEKSDKPVVKIGATLPLSGNIAYIGQAAKHSLQMVLDKWKTKNTKYEYEIVYEDDVLKPQKAVINANKFISLDKVKMVISLFGVVDRPVDDIANKNKVISLSCSYGKDMVPEYGVNVGSVNSDIYPSAIKQLKKDGVKTVALVGSNSETSSAVLDYAAKHLPSDGIKIVADERYAVGETDYRLSIKKLEEKNPDYYIVFGVEPMNTIFAKQFYEITGKNNIASLGALSGINPDNLPNVDGMWSVYVLCNNEKFEKEFFEKYHVRVENCSANLYDGLDMIITAFENVAPNPDTGIPDNEDVLEYVKSIEQWDGAFGPMNIEQNGIMRADVPVRFFQGGKWVTSLDK